MAEISYESPPDPATLALMCAALGWKVFPIRTGTKTPAVKNWPREATTDPEKIMMWWRTSPPVGAPAGAGVGIATGSGSGIWVLDIDVKWAPGLSSVRDLFAAHDTPEPATLKVKSPSGGEQWFFAYPSSTQLSGGWVGNISTTVRAPGPLGPGLDVRGRGGQVVAPLSPGRGIIDPHVPAPAPDWLLKLVTKTGRVATASDEKTRTTAKARRRLETWGVTLRRAVPGHAGGGGRNRELNSAAFHLARTYGASGLLSRTDAWNVLREACEDNGLWGEEPAQCEATFASGWGAGLNVKPSEKVESD